MSETGQRMLVGSKEPTAVSITRSIGSSSPSVGGVRTTLFRPTIPAFLSRLMVRRKEIRLGVSVQEVQVVLQPDPRNERFQGAPGIRRGSAEESRSHPARTGFYNVRDRYAAAPTLHDGKRLSLVVASEEGRADVERLPTVKRKPLPT